VKKFDIIEHTADTGIVAYGTELKEAFANAAYAMFTLIADLEDVKEVVCRQIEVEAGDRESLVVSWLNELLYLFDVEGVKAATYYMLRVEKDNGYSVRVIFDV